MIIRLIVGLMTQILLYKMRDIFQNHIVAVKAKQNLNQICFIMQQNLS